MKTITKEGKKYYLAADIDLFVNILIAVNEQLLNALESCMSEIDCRNKSGEAAWVQAKAAIDKATKKTS